MVPLHVSDDGLRLLRSFDLFYRLHHHPQLLAHQLVRRRHHQHVFVHSSGDEEERFRCRNVSRCVGQ